MSQQKNESNLRIIVKLKAETMSLSQDAPFMALRIMPASASASKLGHGTIVGVPCGQTENKDKKSIQRSVFHISFLVAHSSCTQSVSLFFSPVAQPV